MSETMVKQKHLVGLTGLLCLEVALSQIIPAFRLAPTEAEVVWRNGDRFSPKLLPAESSLQLPTCSYLTNLYLPCNLCTFVNHDYLERLL
ncbi:hypothetical protein EDB85DRAFT_994635 [Lactarius pseudohatsudake]|nr:hypothetical protein EDB85DRAFT_994635 [Lactarius pseudohatsudake]